MRIEHWWYMLPLRLRSLFRRERADMELDEELQFHLERKIEEGIASGLSPEEARHRAMRAMGGLEQKKEEVREARGVQWATDFADDLRYSFRSLRRTPGLSAFVVVTIALGVGMTTTPVSMMDALIFRPYPVPRPGDVVTLVSTSRDDAWGQFSYREYLDIRERTRSYDGVIASAAPQPVGFSTLPGVTPRVAGGMLVSGNYFRALGVEPNVGRGFRDEEDRVPGRDAVVVLAHAFWQRELAGDPTVAGRTIRLNGTDFTIVGVAPESFPGMYVFIRPDLYVPLAMARTFAVDPRTDFFEDRGHRVLNVKARLRQDVPLLEARDELALLARNLQREYPRSNRDRGAAVHTVLEMRTRAEDVEWKFSVVFTGLALAVLLVACTNVAGLLLSRARTRTREIAVRLALGAGRFRVIRLLMAESLVLALLGGLGGVAIGYAGIEYLREFSIPTELPVEVPFRMDGRVLLAAAVLSLLSAVACGVVPALQSTRADLVNGLKTADVDLPGRKRLWGRSALVVAQVAVSLMLLAAAFQLSRSFRQGLVEGVGFHKEDVLLVRFDPRLVQYDAARTRQFYELLTERVRQAPGVRSATLTQNPPLGLGDFEALAFVPEGFQMPRDRETFISAMDPVDEGFFDTLGISIVRGRGILPSDTAEAPRVAVVNEQFAKHYWPGADAIGKRIRLGGAAGTAVEIVGLAQSIKYRETTEKPTDFVYLPLRQHPAARMALLVRTAGDPLAFGQPLRGIVRELDPNMPMLETRTYDDYYRYHAVEGPGIAVRLAATMGTVALMLAIAGLYGLVAYNVSRRTREIGIRVAVGAGPADVLRLVVRRGLVLVATGTAIGLVMALGVERAMKSAIFDTGDVDLALYLVVVPSMFLVTMLAAWLPARRASRIAPAQALRYE